MSAAAFKDRLRADLKTAMQARATDEVRVLRALIAALDNAEAVPVVGAHKYVPRVFGDPSGEVARQVLDGDAVDDVLKSEIDARLSAAADYERHDRHEDAARLRAETMLIAGYRAG